MRLNEVLNQMDKKTRISILSIFLLLISLVSLTVAYFALNITGNPTEDTISVVAADLRLKFTDTNVVDVSGVLPGYTTTKTFTVKNEGNVDLSYIPYFNQVANSFVDQTDLVYTIECISDKQDGTCYNNLVETQLPSNPVDYITRGVTISPQETHTYTMTIIFKDTNDNQNDNQGKRFKARVMIKEDEQPILANFVATGNQNSITIDNPYIPPEFTNIETYYYKYEPVAQNMSNTYETNNTTLASPVAAGEYIQTNEPNYVFENLTPGDYIITSYVEDDRGRTSNECSKQVKVISVMQTYSIPEPEIDIYEYEDWDITWFAEPDLAPDVIKNSNFENIEHLYSISTTTISENALGSWTEYDSEWDETYLYWYTDEDNNGLYEVYYGYEPLPPVLDYEIGYSTILINAPTVLTSDTFEYQSEYGFNIESLEFNTSNVVPNGVLGSWDVSEAQDSSIMAWYTDTDSDELYEVTIGQTGGVNPNPDSRCLFCHMRNLEEIDFSNFNFKNVVYAEDMFSSTGSSDGLNLIGIENLDTSNVVNMSKMFYGTVFIPISNSRPAPSNNRYDSAFEIKSLENNKSYDIMLQSTPVPITYELDLSSWDTSNVTDMSQMFETINYGELSYGNTVSLVEPNTPTLLSETYTRLSINMNSWNTSNVVTMENMFYEAGDKIDYFNIEGLEYWDTSNVFNMAYMFYGIHPDGEIFSIDLSSWDTSNIRNMSHMFQDSAKGASVWNIGDIGSWDVSNVTRMQFMFESAGVLSDSFILDLSAWNTTNVFDMSSMFYDCGSYSSEWSIGDLTQWDTSSVELLSSFLDYFSKQNYMLNLFKTWDLPNVNYIGKIFYEYRVTEEDIKWVESLNLKNYSSLFYRADISLVSDNIEQMDMSNIVDTSYMFGYATWNQSSFELDLSSWDVSNVTTMSAMFDQAGLYSTNFDVNLS